MSAKAWRMHSWAANGTGIPMESYTVDPGIEAFMEKGGAHTVATVSGQKRGVPVLKGQSKDLKTVIDLFGLFGYAVTGSGSNKVVLYFGKVASGGTFASGSVHKSLTVNKALVVIESISAKGNDAASISFAVYAEYDGTNDPFVIADSVALPATPARLSTLYVCGPVDNGGGAVEAQGININFGPDVVSIHKDGDTYPTLVAVREFKLAVEVDTLDADALAANDAVTDVVVYFRKCTPNGAGRVADATAEHIAFTFASTYNYAGQGSLNGANEGSFQHKFTPIFDGTNAAMAVDTTAAIA